MLKLEATHENTYCINNNSAKSTTLTIYDENFNPFERIYFFEFRDIVFLPGTYYFVLYFGYNKAEVNFSINVN